MAADGRRTARTGPGVGAAGIPPGVVDAAAGHGRLDEPRRPPSARHGPRRCRFYQLDGTPVRLAAWSDRQDLARLGADTTGWRQIASTEYGIDLVAPYLDNEVIRACLAIPADQRGAPGRYKPLLNTAFTGAGVLPDFVLTRTTKGGFNALAYAGLRENTPVLLDLLGPSSRLAAAGLVTEQPIARMLARAAAGQPTAQGALHLAVAAEVWLRQADTAALVWEVNSGVAAV